MIFEYSVQRTFNESIDVPDIGNMALRCTSRNVYDFFIITKTVMGKTNILKFGPVCSDLEALMEDFSVVYKKIDYKESSIFKEVDRFINDYKKDIDEVLEITEYEAWQQFPPIKQYFENA